MISQMMKYTVDCLTEGCGFGYINNILTALLAEVAAVGVECYIKVSGCEVGNRLYAVAGHL